MRITEGTTASEFEIYGDPELDNEGKNEMCWEHLLMEYEKTKRRKVL